MKKSDRNDTGEIECYLVVPGTRHRTLPSVLAEPAMQKPIPATPSTVGETSVAINAAARERFAAERKARFSANYGAAHSARLDQIAAQYRTLKPGSVERLKFFADHQNELWQANRR